MPFSERQLKAVRARSHGWMPRQGKKGPFGNVSEDKAREMLDEAGQQNSKRKKSKVQRRAFGGKH